MYSQLPSTAGGHPSTCNMRKHVVARGPPNMETFYVTEQIVRCQKNVAVHFYSKMINKINKSQI
jgi:hypothetical protein